MISSKLLKISVTLISTYKYDFPFFLFLGKTQLNEKRPYLYLFKIYTKVYTLPYEIQNNINCFVNF